MAPDSFNPSQGRPAAIIPGPGGDGYSQPNTAGRPAQQVPNDIADMYTQPIKSAKRSPSIPATSPPITSPPTIIQPGASAPVYVNLDAPALQSRPLPSSESKSSGPAPAVQEVHYVNIHAPRPPPQAPGAHAYVNIQSSQAAAIAAAADIESKLSYVHLDQNQQQGSSAPQPKLYVLPDYARDMTGVQDVVLPPAKSKVLGDYDDANDAAFVPKQGKDGLVSVDYSKQGGPHVTPSFSRKSEPAALSIHNLNSREVCCTPTDHGMLS